MIDVAVELGVDLGLKHRVDHAKLRHLFGLEVVWIIEHLAVAVAENVGGVPTTETEHAGLEARGEKGLEPGLASLEVLAGDRHVLASGEFTHAGKIDGKVWCTVGERNMGHECGIRVDLARRDVLVVVAQAFFKGRDGHVDSAGFLVGLGRTTPHHDESVTVVLGAEVFDVGDEGLGLSHFVGDVLDAGAVEALYPALIEDGVHGNNALEFGRDGAEVPIFKHACGAGGLKSIRADGIPAAEDKVAQVGQRHELTDERVAVFFPLAQTDVGELAE